MRRGFSGVRLLVTLCWGILPVLLCGVPAPFASKAFAQDAISTPEYQTEATPSPPPSDSTWTLDGSVINAITGAPVRRALVQVSDAPNGSQLTDTEGRFQFTNLPDGSVTLTVRKPGFFTHPELAQDRPDTIPFQIPSHSEPVSIGLVPAGVLTGEISDENGEPVEGVRIRLLRTKVVQGRKQWRQVTSGRSDDDGQFRIPGLAPGMYYAVTDPTAKPHVNLGKNTNRVLECYPAVYYPNTVDLASASAIQVTGGVVAKADFSLRAEHSYSVSGAVTGYPNGQSVYFQILNASGDALTLDTQFNPDTGTFHIKMLPAGVYTIHARSLDQHGNGFYASSPISVRGNIKDALVALRPTLLLPMDIQFQSPTDGENNLEDPVSVRFFAPDSSLSFAPLGLDYWSSRGKDDHGSPAIRNLEPGTYVTEFHPKGDWYVSSASYGTIDLFRDPAAVSTRPEAIEIGLRNDGATLSGIVQLAGDPAQGSVLLLRAATPALLPTIVHTNDKGEFRVEHLAPGEYTVVAFDHLEGLEYTNPEVMQTYLPRSSHASLQPNQETNVSVDLIRLGGE